MAPSPRDVLHPHADLRIGDTTISVDSSRPLAVVDRVGKSRRIVTWAGAPQPTLTFSTRLIAADDAVWVICLVQSESVHVPADPGPVPAVRIGVDGSVTWIDAGPGHVLGAENDAVWVDETDQGAGWSELRTLHRRSIDGNNQLLTIDRPVLWTESRNGFTNFVVERTLAPDVDHSDVDHSDLDHADGTKLRRDYAVVRLDPGSMTASAIIFDELDPVSVTTITDENLDDFLPTMSPDNEGSRLAPIDLDGGSNTAWPLVDLPEEEIVATVAAGLRLFGSLDEYWHDHDRSLSPVSRGLTDSEVRAVGSWPDTELEITFAHPHVTSVLGSSARMRRRLRLFDAAGRISLSEYADIHLKEDLDTRNFPRPDDAIDGILDF